MPELPVATDPAWIAQFADRCGPAEPQRPPASWRRELAELNEELRSRFALSTGGRRVLGAQVLKLVAAHFGLTRAEIVGGSRHARYVRARQIAMYLCVRIAGLSQAQTGALFGRDHTTVLHALRRAEARIAVDSALARTIDELVVACRSSPDGNPATTRMRSP